MFILRYLFTLLLPIAFLGCQQQEARITDRAEYERFLQPAERTDLQTLQANYAFWSAKWESDRSQHPYLIKMAGIQEQMFQATGDIEYLKREESLLTSANETVRYEYAGYLRMLARNYISQHRFREALALLEKAEENGQDIASTHKMLFDAHLELGNRAASEYYLSTIYNEEDFNYLIRVAKWEDHEGRLDRAITYMERAMAKAGAQKDEALLQWSYTNLADFYGHDGRIKDSYEHYLKALAIDPHDAYAKKGIAWIVFSYERDAARALSIVKAITAEHQAPDYLLMQAEIQAYLGNPEEAATLESSFLKAIQDERYGVMYNKYKAILLADRDEHVEEALQIALLEVEMRPTPPSYSLLAWAYFKSGDPAVALAIAEDQVVDKSFEPEVQYHLAEIYKANERYEKTAMLKRELSGCGYELGPVMAEKIAKL